ncbi:MAG: trans-sulfuration enzyme family protein, partial [Candidatus Puniceispirillaceae bacterium]
MANSDHHIDTQLQHLGLSPEDNHGIPNPPIYRTSTILSSSMAQHRHEVPKPYDYGRIGTPTSAAFEQSVAALYEADDCISTPSGLSAISTALLSACDAGTHLLVPDPLYGSARRFVEKTLSKLGVEITFYPPRINARITSLIQDNTSVIYIESPGSLTFELQDIRSIIEIARARNITTLCDNTWGTALHYPVLRYGIDIVIEAGTKYISGHSDTNLGIAAASGEHARNLRNTARNLGICAGPEDLYLGLRGLRTLRLRLEQSAANGLAVATAIKDHSLVNAMLHPAMADSPDNEI